MNVISRITMCVATVAITMAMPSLAWADQEGDVNIGIDAGGKLVYEFDADELIPIPPSPFALLSGFLIDDPGFFSIERDEIDEGIFALPGTALIGVEIVSLDPAFRVWNNGLTNTLNIGDFFNAGSAPFDTHPWWQIDDTDPSYDPSQLVYEVIVRMVDLNGNFGTSDNLTLSFTPVPEPTSAVALLVMAAIAGKRRRGSN